jgi:putative hemolysin/predicted secreted protein
MSSLPRPGRFMPGLIALGILLVLLACAAGCTQQTTTPATPAITTPAQAGMPNPASVACEKAGGTLEIKKDATGGEYGMCTFANGTSCEEWALYHNEGCKPGVSPASTTAAAAGMANPASVACGAAGGKTEIKTDATGGQYGMCTFSNGTSCEEWALYHNEGCKPGVSPAVTTTASTGAATGGKQMVTFTEADNGKTKDITQGTKLAVALKENPTTGFQWNATLSKGLELVSDNFQTDSHAEGMVGVGGTRTWVILAKDTGDQKFSAVYRRSWEAVTGSENAFNVTIKTVKA